MSKKSTICKNWPKYLVQWGVLAALIFFMIGLVTKVFPKVSEVNPEAYCPLGGVEALSTYLANGSLPCTMTTLQIVLGIALAISVILFSKLFCAFLCPIGSVEDLLIKLRKALHFKGISIKNGGIADKALRIIKYGMVFWIFYMTCTSSELFCKTFDPYYAVATGFKGEITLWMSLVTIGIVILGGVVVDRFWCKYICPLGAISNSFKFWIWLVVLGAAYYVLGLIGVNIPWIWLLGAFCLLGYCLEILIAKPKFQLLHVVKDDSKCTKCGLCVRECPYNIDVANCNGKLESVDCTLCGECVASCNTEAIHIGACKKSKKTGFSKFIPIILAAIIVAGGFWFGNKFELPTIDETWGIEAYDEDSTLVQLIDPSTLKTMSIEPLASVKCYGSSMAFKNRVSRIAGIYGVKTFVASHKVVLKYDPATITPEQIQEKIFVPSNFRVVSPELSKTDSVKVVVIRTEHMNDKMDLNYLGLQMRQTDKKIFGVESEFACPLIVKVYMDASENIDEKWFKEIVEKKVLAMPIHGGGVKETPLDFKFVKLEEGETYMKTTDYLEMMFNSYASEFDDEYTQGDSTYTRDRTELYAGQPQFIYNLSNTNYEKPVVSMFMPYLSNYLSKEEGVIGVYLLLNKEYVPTIQIRYAAPMTAAKVWELITRDKWNITYKDGSIREEDAKISFEEEGYEFPYSE